MGGSVGYAGRKGGHPFELLRLESLGNRARRLGASGPDEVAFLATFVGEIVPTKSEQEHGQMKQAWLFFGLGFPDFQDGLGAGDPFDGAAG